MTLPPPQVTKYSVLIVDDIPETRLNLRKMLQFETRIEVVGMAEGGAKGIKMAENIEPDIVLMDVEMPEMDGIAACEKIVKKRLSSKVIMMSIQDDPEYLRRSILAGAKEFLVKPFSSDELVACIRRVLSMGPLARAEAAVISAGSEVIRLFILGEQHQVLQESFFARPDINLVGSALNDEPGWQQMIEAAPGVCLIEVVPAVDGLIASRSIRRSSPQARIVLIAASQEEADYLHQSQFAKDVSLLVRPFTNETLLAIVRQTDGQDYPKTKRKKR